MATGFRSEETNQYGECIVLAEEDMWDGDCCPKDCTWSYPDSVVTQTCLNELLECFSVESYKTSNQENKSESVMKRCIILFSKDYETEVVKNANGNLCNHYPSEIIIPKGEIGRVQPEGSPPGFEDPDVLRELFASSRTARCRSRFVVPVILLNDHTHICRSATLATYAELCGRQGYDWLSSMWSYGPNSQTSSPLSSLEGNQSKPTFDKNGPVTSSLPANPSTEDSNVAVNGTGSTSNGVFSHDDQPAATTDSDSENDRMTKTRLEDVKLLKALKISLISDLMVENKKTKYFVTVSSSEKVDKSQRYAEFGIASMPYPGCEFFRSYKSNNYNGKGLRFDWEQPEIDADFSLPSSLPSPEGIDCQQHQTWDLIQITQNYLLILLGHLSADRGGLLVHCISGWDRTPLFISLLRLSLWADGLIHQRLSPPEIVYLTLAYDWYLFGHQFHDRIVRGEEILYFCFDVLSSLTDERFSCKVPVEPRHWNVPESHRELSTVSPSSSDEDPSPPTPTPDVLDVQQCDTDGPDGPQGSDHKASPVAINKKRKSNDETANSVGSWQILSLTDDVRDVVGARIHAHSSRDSPSRGETPLGHSRKQKLESARSIFLSAYQITVPRTSINSAGGSGLGSLFNRLTGSLKLV